MRFLYLCVKETYCALKLAYKSDITVNENIYVECRIIRRRNLGTEQSGTKAS